MEDSSPPDGKRVAVFLIDERYMFKHYFNDGYVFNRLKEYYNNKQYRFEIPKNEYDSTRSFLQDRGYNLVLVDDMREYIIVVKKYTSPPENIFKDSIIQRSVGEYHCFLMKDANSVQQAPKNKAVKLPQTNLENPFR